MTDGYSKTTAFGNRFEMINVPFKLEGCVTGVSEICALRGKRDCHSDLK